MEAKSDEEPYKDPRAQKTLATFTEKEIYGKLFTEQQQQTNCIGHVSGQ